jgi:hypothetical protein
MINFFSFCKKALSFIFGLGDDIMMLNTQSETILFLMSLDGKTVEDISTGTEITSWRLDAVIVGLSLLNREEIEKVCLFFNVSTLAFN